MSDPEFADFDNYRYLRDHEDEIASMRSPIRDDLVIPVLDCDSFQLVRLHVFDGADDPDRVANFEAEMDRLSNFEERLVAAPIKWGIDPSENKIFYLNQFLDGQPLASYLDEVGEISVGVAALWLIPFIGVFEQLKHSAPKMNKENLFVARNLETNLPELHLTEFTSWLEPDKKEKSIDYHFAQIFLAMISGIGNRTFDKSSTPKEFDYLPETCQETILKSLSSKPGENESPFFRAIKELTNTGEFSVPDFPRSSLQDWFQEEINHLSETLVLDPDHEPEDDLSEVFIIPGEHEELPCSIQIFPGIGTIGKDYFFAQHVETLRRFKRNAANQLAIYDVVENNSITTITEEEPVGFHLEEVFREVRTMDIEHVNAMVKRLTSALDGLEATSSNSLPVWHLPTHSIFVVWQNHEVEGFVRALDHEGPDLWSKVSFRLRLHLTTVDLHTGIEMPASIRELADQLSTDDPQIRRTATLLPLMIRALTGNKPDWNKPVEIDNDHIPDEVGNFLNSRRTILINNPTTLSGDFIARIDQLITELNSKQTTTTPTPQSNRNAGVKDILSTRLGSEKIDLGNTLYADDTEELYEELSVLENEKDLVEGLPMVSTYKDGKTYTPEELNNQQPTKQEREAKKQELRQRIEEREKERQLASRRMLGLDNDIVQPPKRRKNSLAWLILCAIALAACGISAYYYADKRKSNSATTTKDLDVASFPPTHYDVVTPEVDPFSDLVPNITPTLPDMPDSIAAGINDPELAISRSKTAIQNRDYSDAVEYTLKAIELSPSSQSADHLEFILKSWVSSGFNAPETSDDSTATEVLIEHHIKGSARSKTESGVSAGLYLLMNAIVKGNTKAMRTYALLFGQGKLVPKSPSIASKWLKKAAENDDNEARFYLGESSVFGTMIPSNQQGFKFLEKAAKNGHPRSLLFQGYCHIEGIGGVEKNEAKGFIFISDAAARGSSEAVFQMGLCHVNGIGTNKDERIAALAFKSAAELGYVPAMYYYSQCLIHGIGSDPAYNKGVIWMKKAATTGYFNATKWCARNGINFNGEPEKPEQKPKIDPKQAPKSETPSEKRPSQEYQQPEIQLF